MDFFEKRRVYGGKKTSIKELGQEQVRGIYEKEKIGSLVRIFHFDKDQEKFANIINKATEIYKGIFNQALQPKKENLSQNAIQWIQPEVKVELT